MIISSQTAKLERELVHGPSGDINPESAKKRAELQFVSQSIEEKKSQIEAHLVREKRIQAQIQTVGYCSISIGA